jgi:hypothetical protein
LRQSSHQKKRAQVVSHPVCVINGRPELRAGDGGTVVFGWAGWLLAVKGGTTGSTGAPATPSPARPCSIDLLRGLRGLRYPSMSQRVTSGFSSMICVYLCVFAGGRGVRDGAGGVGEREGRAVDQIGSGRIVVNNQKQPLLTLVTSAPG